MHLLQSLSIWSLLVDLRLDLVSGQEKDRLCAICKLELDFLTSDVSWGGRAELRNAFCLSFGLAIWHLNAQKGKCIPAAPPLCRSADLPIPPDAFPAFPALRGFVAPCSSDSGSGFLRTP